MSNIYKIIIAILINSIQISLSLWALKRSINFSECFRTVLVLWLSEHAELNINNNRHKPIRCFETQTFRTKVMWENVTYIIQKTLFSYVLSIEMLMYHQEHKLGSRQKPRLCSLKKSQKSENLTFIVEVQNYRDISQNHLLSVLFFHIHVLNYSINDDKAFRPRPSKCE